MRVVCIFVVLVSRVMYFKVFVLCFICIFVYVYLYLEVNFQSLMFYKMIMVVIGDFWLWQKQVWELWDYIRYGEFFMDIDLVEKDRNIIRNYVFI